MEPSRIESYIRATCSVLDFDIGELWCAKKRQGNDISLKFIQLYSSPAFEDFHSLLIQPEKSPDFSSGDEEKHRISPIICRGVCDGGQIVWANARASRGLTGRSEVPLNTAVGVPICSIGSDLYVLVLFAVDLLPMAPSAVEYLICVVRAVAMSTGGFLSASFSAKVAAPQTTDFVGQECDFNELFAKYTKDVDFKLLSMNKIQKYFDGSEITLFCELFSDYKVSRKGSFTEKQLESLRDAFKIPSHLLTENGDHSERNQAFKSESERPTSSCNSMRALSEVACSIGFLAPSGSASADGSAQAGSKSPDAGVYCADSDNAPLVVDLASLQRIRQSLNGSGSSGIDTDSDNSPRNVLALLRRSTQTITSTPDESLLHIYAHMSYRLSQCRFHEFMIAVLGMTVFDSAELWLLSKRSSELHLMAAVYRTATMLKWTTSGIDLRLPVGCDVAGRVVKGEQFCWDAHYSTAVPAIDAAEYVPSGTSSNASTDPNKPEGERNGPRTKHAQGLGIHTAFGVPVPGLRGPCGSLVFYSTKKNLELDPLMVQLIENAMLIMANPALDPQVRAEGADHHGSAKISNWLTAARASSASNALAGPHKLFTDVAAVSSDSSVSMILPTHSLDFNRRLHLCRTIVANKKIEFDDKADSAGKTHTSATQNATLRDLALMSSALTSVGYSIGSTVTDAKPSAAAATTSKPALASSSSSSTTSDTPQYLLDNKLTPSTVSVLPAPVNEELYSDAVVSAARALANFGNFQWGTFLEGSGIEENTDGYQSIKLGSDKVLDMYADWHAAAGSRKRKFDRNAPRFPVPGADGEAGLPMCLVDGCNYQVENAESQYCTSHRGTRRCQKEGCGKCAQGATKYCIAHGGGRRCTYPGCFKGARDKLFCAAHGGGKRCTFEGCTKSAVGGSQLCTAHGGGKRCKFEGCNKSSQSSTDFCVKHGGGRSCMFKGCNKVARGKTDFCAAHGGGVRCKAKGCYKIAVGATSLCRMHSSALAAATAAGASMSTSSSADAGDNAVSNKPAQDSGDDDDDDESMDEQAVLYAAGRK